MDHMEIANALKINDIVSTRLYRSGYQEQMVGKSIQDQALHSYPSELNAFKNSKNISEAHYRKKGKEFQMTGKLPLDCMEFDRIQKNALNMSDAHYRASREKAIKDHKAWQTMEPAKHPLVIKKNIDNMLMSEAAYKREAQEIQDGIYYPVFITEGYELAKKISHDTSNAIYKRAAKAIEAEHKYNYAQSEMYNTGKTIDSVLKDHEYTKSGKAVAAKPLAIPSNDQMEMAQRLNPYWSAEKYKRAAKELATKYSITMDEQVMANALRIQQLTSAKMYKKGYNEQIVGKSIQDQSLHSYPSEQNAFKNSKNISEAHYRKKGKEFQMTGKLPNDCMEFERIRKNADNMSDAKYKKTMGEAIATHKAWQTMDSSLHPIVNQKKLAEALYSEAAYRSDAMEEAQGSIYYPVQITEGYELAKKVTQATSQAIYTRDAKKIEAHNIYNFADSSQYDTTKKMGELVSHKYEADAKAAAAKGGKQETTPMMEIAKDLSPYWSNSQYVAAAKKLAEKYNLTMDDQRVALALKITADVSDRLYKEGYKLNCVGQPINDQRLENYQSEFNAYKVAKATSHAAYVKEGNKTKTTGKLPLDCIDFVRSEKVAKIASDSLYRKTRNDVLKKYRGWQTMDSTSHPVVTEGVRKQNLLDRQKYIEEARGDLAWTFYPVHITENYGLCLKNQANVSDKIYQKDYEASKAQGNKYDYSKSDMWQTAKIGKSLLPHHYEKKGRQMAEKPIGAAENAYMEMAKEMSNVWSSSKYCQAARALAGKFTITMDDMSIALALKISDVTNEKAYKKGYNEQILGRAPVDPSLHSYQNEAHGLKMGAQISESAYRKKGKQQQMTGKLPLDCIDFNRSRNQRAITSTALYKKSRDECVKKYRGWQTMDYSQHPLILQGAALSLVQSNILYKLDAKEDGEGVFFPCHVTEGYNLALQVSRITSDRHYKKKALDEQHKTIFNYTLTDNYQRDLKNQNVLNNQSYVAKAKEAQVQVKPLAVTAEMERSKTLQPFLSDAQYTTAAKAIQEKYNLMMDIQSMAHALQIGKDVSDLVYKEDYNKNVKGKMNQLAESYPEYQHLKAVADATSNAAYTAKGREVMNKFNIPLDYPLLNLAKQNSLNISDRIYQKQRRKVIDDYKGYMRMDAHQHPVVLKGLTANLIASNKLYKEQWEEEKDWVYFPFQITEGYIENQKLNKIKGKDYKQKPYEGDINNKYDITKAVTYKPQQDAQASLSSQNYAAKSKAIASQYKGIETTPEAEKAKAMKEIWSIHYYQESAKEAAGKYNLQMDVMEMTRALKVNAEVSKLAYQKIYKEDIKGKSVQNPAIAYPEYEHLAKVSLATSDAKYREFGDEIKHKYTLCVDYPPFLRAKELSLLLSGEEYKKQYRQAVNDFKGFMRMDASLHPLVVQGEKINKLFSDNHYKSEWEEEKSWVYFPYHISPGYEQSKLNEKSISDKRYKQPVTADNKFDIVKTEKYEQDKNLVDKLSHQKYAQKAKLANVSDIHPQAVMPEMVKSRFLEQYLSKKAYTDAAAEIKAKYNIDAHDFHLKHDMQITAQFSDRKYKEDFDKKIKGLFPKDVKIAYPEYEFRAKTDALVSDAAYKKDAESKIHTYTIKEDYPMFTHAVEAYNNMSDVKYTKGRYDAVKDMKGFQRMDAAQHPVVQRGQAVYNIISQRKYVEDWMEEKEYVYFPVQITEAYNNSLKVSKYQSNITYMSSFQRFKYDHSFRYDEAPSYQFSLNLQKQVSDALYNKQAKNLREGARWAAHLTPKCVYDKELKHLLSEENYKREARKIMDSYSVDMHTPVFQNSLQVNKFISHTRYTEVYRKKTLGKFLASKLEDYPAYKHAFEISQQQSSALYKKEADSMMHSYTLVADQHQFQAAKEHTKLMSSEYGSGKRQAINEMKGFMRMDASTHPVVVQGAEKSKLVSEKNYRQDYHEDKEFNMFIYSIAPIYKQTTDANKITSRNYQADAKKLAAETRYPAHLSENFQNNIKNQQMAGGNAYKKDYETNVRGKAPKGISNEHEMYLMKEIMPLLSAKRYQEQAKLLQGQYNLCSDMPEIIRAYQAQSLTSEAIYRKKYINDVVGKSCDIKDAEIFAQYKSVANLVSDALYKKQALETMQNFNNNFISNDMKHAAECMKVISDNSYCKDMQEVWKKFSSFSRLRLEHNKELDFQRHIQAQISNFEYKRDYEEEKAWIYFPYHITEGYQLATDVSKNISDKEYKKGYNNNKSKGNVFKGVLGFQRKKCFYLILQTVLVRKWTLNNIKTSKIES